MERFPTGQEEEGGVGVESGEEVKHDLDTFSEWLKEGKFSGDSGDYELTQFLEKCNAHDGIGKMLLDGGHVRLFKRNVDNFNFLGMGTAEGLMRLGQEGAQVFVENIDRFDYADFNFNYFADKLYESGAGVLLLENFDKFTLSGNKQAEFAREFMTKGEFMRKALADNLGKFNDGALPSDIATDLIRKGFGEQVKQNETKFFKE